MMSRRAHMRTIKFTASSICSFLLFVSVSLSARTVTIVDKATSSFVVVLPDTPAEAEILAAKELVRYVEMISGVRLERSSVSEAPDRAHHIYIGAVSDIRKRKMIPEAQHRWDDRYTLKISQEEIVIAGCNPRGTLNGVYDLLERLGCRWYAPRMDHYQPYSGEVIPERPVLTIPETDEVCVPDNVYRITDLAANYMTSIEHFQQIAEWMPKARFNIFMIPMDLWSVGIQTWDEMRSRLIPMLQERDLIIKVGQHGYQNFLPPKDYFQEHPDWFALHDGERTREQRFVFCTSKEDARKEIIRRVIAYLREHPEIQIFDFWPPDGDRWCECGPCEAMGSPTVRHAFLVNEMTEALRKAIPHVQLEWLAYSKYVAPPEGVTLHPSTLNEFCPISRDWDYYIWDGRSERNSRYWENLTGWFRDFAGDIAFYTYYRKDSWNNLPLYIGNMMREELHRIRMLGGRGASSYFLGSDWVTYEFNYYIFGQILWNDDIDVDEALREYCAHRFGPAAALMFEHFKIRERHVIQLIHYVHGRAKTIPANFIREKKAVFQTALDLIETAQSMTDDPLYRFFIQQQWDVFFYPYALIQMWDAQQADKPMEVAHWGTRLLSHMDINKNRGYWRHYDDALTGHRVRRAVLPLLAAARQQTVQYRYLASVRTSHAGKNIWSYPTVPYMLFDERFDQVWSTGGQESGWIEVELQMPEKVSGITLHTLPGTVLKTFRVKVSSDGNNWETLQDENSGTSNYVHIENSEEPIQYIRIEVDRVEGRTGYLRVSNLVHLAEVQIWQDGLCLSENY